MCVAVSVCVCGCWCVFCVCGCVCLCLCVWVCVLRVSADVQISADAQIRAQSSAQMNSRGVTPNSKMVAEMLVQQWPAHVHQPHVKEWLSRLPNEAKLRRRWLVKLRRFWGVHYRKLGSRNHQSPADEKRKVQR